MNLLRFQRPSRYINSEWNAVHKKGELKIALAFPDLYEIGMSHLGLRILYEILNSMEGVVAERVFAPWHDMEEYMRRNGLYLSSLESKTPLKDFDVVGFSLQYELSITTVLNMLELGGIPLLRGKRKALPIVIAGGPCTVNPAPFERFFDALFIGEAEYAIQVFAKTLKEWKRNGDKRRETLLKEISKIEGFYVPGISKTIRRCIIADLNIAPYPLRFVVSHNAVHDRLNIEISRGCPKGCRFCQAGIIYRPVRERSVERILDITIQGLSTTGYEEVSFTSLSAGDYNNLEILLKSFNAIFSHKRITVSLPSLRVGAVRKEILSQLKAIRKTGFTIAPEAATERLRSVINKDFSEADYERALNILFQEGWLNLKLYFMIGLPTETHQDIEEIIHMSLKALKIAKKYIKRFVNISVGISPFIPKPHTPFQWCGQEDIETLKGKTCYLKESLERKGLNYRGHDPEMSLVEAIISRGDERIGELIYQAWRLGSKLDAWTDLFDFKRWLDAMALTGIDGFSFAKATCDEEFFFPWDIVDTGIEKEFLIREFKNTFEQKRTSGCEIICSACGLGCTVTSPLTVTSLPKESCVSTNSKRGESQIEEDLSKKFQRSFSSTPAYSVIRTEFSKIGNMRYLGHLEFMRLIERALRRADIPFQFSEGYHPSPRISFGPPLPVGVEGLREYFDMVVDLRSLFKEMPSTTTSPSTVTLPSIENLLSLLKERINNYLPDGVRINKLFLIPPNTPSISSFINCYEYFLRFKVDEETTLTRFVDSISGELRVPENLKPYILHVTQVEQKGLRILLIDRNNKKIRIMEFIKDLLRGALEEDGEVTVGGEILVGEDIDIIRTGLYGLVDGRPIPPT